MSLVYIDGFDHYATADLPQKGWTVAGTYTDKQSIAATGGRRGSGGLRFTNLNGVLSAYVIRAVPSQQTIIVGFNVNLSAIPQGGSSPWTFFNLLDGATSQIALVINNSGSVTVRRGNGTNLGTTSEVLVAGDNYLELRTTIDPTAGAYEVRLNGVTVLAATGVNTRQSENSAVNALSFGVYEAGSTITNSFLMTIDDLYIASTAGSTNNYFLGDVRIDTLFPTADGTYSQFTPSTAGAHYVLVDDPSVNTTDYVASATPGHRDTFVMASLPATASAAVFGVQVVAAAMRDDAGGRTAALTVRSGGANADSAAKGLGTTQAFLSAVFETDPAAAAWTATTVNAMEAGLLVAS